MPPLFRMALLIAGLFLSNFSWAASDDGSSCRANAASHEAAFVTFHDSSSCPTVASMFTGNDHCRVIASSEGFECLPNQSTPESTGVVGGPYYYDGCLSSDPENCGGTEEPEPEPEPQDPDLPDATRIVQNNNYLIGDNVQGAATGGGVAAAFRLQQRRAEASLLSLQSRMTSEILHVIQNSDESLLKVGLIQQAVATTHSNINTYFVDFNNRLDGVSTQVGTVQIGNESILSKIDQLSQDLSDTDSNFDVVTGRFNSVQQQIGQLQSNLGSMDGAIARIEMNAASKFDVSQSEGNLSSQMGEQFGQIMGGIYSNWTPTTQKIDDSYAALSDQIAGIS